ncbi:MAG TPA: flotillin-like FloA family protein, partial [Longimicrobiales bacterium]
AKVQEQRAAVVQAEAQVPLAMAEAFRSGNLGIMDYARYRNISADTEMRQSLAGPVDGDGTKE